MVLIWKTPWLAPPKPLKHHPVQPPRRLGEAGGCHWFPPAYFLVARTTHRKCTGTHIIKPSRPGDSRWHVGGCASSTTWLLLQQGARHEQITLLKATVCQHGAGEMADSLHSELLTLKCLHQVLFPTTSIQTLGEVYVKWVIVSLFH